jgi:Spy/CpxP family protein refolding chaperone
MKKMRFALSIAALTWGLAAAQTTAAPPARPSPADIAAHQTAFLAGELSLTADQQKQVSTILANAAAAQSAVRSNLETAHKAIETGVENNDTAAIATAASKIGELTAQQVQAKATADAAIYALLTPEQQAKWKAVATHGPRGFGRGAPGMPPPPPPDR